MKMVDYTGKLNQHADYLNMLRVLKQKCTYLEYVLLSDDDSFVEKYREQIVSVKGKNKWWGTKSSGKSDVYRLRAVPDMFRDLRKHETFCIFKGTEMGDVAVETSFGWNDIAFFDDRGELPLLYTTTHEGEVMVRDDLHREVSAVH